jgi:putative endonuclease
LSDLRSFGRQPHTVARGRLAEEAAAAWLTRRGYRIVERNHRNHAGEIDLIAWQGETLCFVEVKARAEVTFGPAAAAVGWEKRRRLGRAAALYLAQRGGPEPACRFDVLAVEGRREPTEEESRWRFSLITDAFRLE